MSDRKLRLFLVGCCRARWDLLAHPTYRAAVEVAERYADGTATAQEMAAAGDAAWVPSLASSCRTQPAVGPAEEDAARSDFHAGQAARLACMPAARLTRSHMICGGPRPAEPGGPVNADGVLDEIVRAVWRHLVATLGNRALPREATVAAESARQADLLRCVVGNPFHRTSIDTSWLTTDVAGLAGAVYDLRAFDRLPVLADALQDAGCDDEAVLGHCHGVGPHVRGCWVVDLLTGRA